MREIYHAVSEPLDSTAPKEESGGLTVCRIDLPLGTSPVMVVILQDTVRRKIPHLWVVVVNILLHTERGFLGLILSIAHRSEFGQRFVDGTAAMRTGKPLVALALFTPSTLDFDFGLCKSSIFACLHINPWGLNKYVYSGRRRLRPSGSISQPIRTAGRSDR